MPTTYTPSLTLSLLGTGEDSGNWGSLTNTNLSLIEQAITGWVQIAVSGSTDHTLTTSNGTSNEARCMGLAISGATTAPINIIIPAVNKFYIVYNQTSYPITITSGAGATVTLNVGQTRGVMCDGGDVHPTFDDTILVAGTGIALDVVGNVTTIRLA